MAKHRSFKYPRLTLLLVIIIATFTIFSSQELWLGRYLVTLGITGAFISGILYAFSFTSFTSSILFFELGKNGNILLTATLGGLGTVIADLIILKTAKVSFHHEFELLYKEKFLRLLFKSLPKPLLHTFKIITAMLIIASPLPDEAGVTLLANGYILPKKIFVVLSFFLNFFGIYSILLLGHIL